MSRASRPQTTVVNPHAFRENPNKDIVERY